MLLTGIGIPLVWLQPVLAQENTAELFTIAPDDRDAARWLSECFTRGLVGWRDVWQRSLDMGASLGPFLANELLSEESQTKRLVLTAAYSLATRHPQENLLGREVFLRRDRDRVMALFTMALGRRQPRIDEATRRRLESLDTPLERIAACMAMARFEAPDELPRGYYNSKDAGVLAAALFCRTTSMTTASWIRSRRVGEHEDLVWRGYLLGRSHGESPDADRQKLALEVLRTGTPSCGPEAAWFLAHNTDQVLLNDAELADLSLQIKLLLCHSKTWRDAILRVSSGVPSATEDPGLRQRWFALYARWAGESELETTVDRWRDSVAREPLILALAWRLFSTDLESARGLQLDLDWLTDDPLAAWLRLAVGEDVSADVRFPNDPPLDRAFQAAKSGRLPRARCAEVLERTLWRSGTGEGGAHPGLQGLDLQRQFLGEILIDGSQAAGTRFASPGRSPYVARRLDRNDELFTVAYELYKFIREEEPWALREYRLEN